MKRGFLRSFCGTVKIYAEPYKISDLKIRGEDLKKLGISGRGVGDTLEALRRLIINDPTLNTKKRLTEAIAFEQIN